MQLFSKQTQLVSLRKRSHQVSVQDDYVAQFLGDVDLATADEMQLKRRSFAGWIDLIHVSFPKR